MTVETVPDLGAKGVDPSEWRIAVRCQVCRRWLTDPASVKAGVGPKCGGASE